MTNHFHLLLRSLEGNLPVVMKFLSGCFTRLINLRVGRDVPLFRGRYRSVLIASDAHLVQTCRYIHRNPVVARIAPTAESWRWSSAAAYLGRGKRRSWLKTDAILE